MIQIQNQFWPTTAKDWLYLIGGLSSYIVISITFFYRAFIFSKLKSLNKRLFNVNTKIQTQFGKHYHIEAFMERSERDRKDIHEDIGRIYNSMRSINDSMHNLELKWLGAVSDIKETVIEVQTKLDIVLRRLDNLR